MSIKEDFEHDGVVVCRGLINHVLAGAWGLRYGVEVGERTPEFNPVAVNDSKLQPLLESIYRHPRILDRAEEIFGPDIALYNARFVVKDKRARGPVFLHQDTGYHFGHMRKLSAFVALSECGAVNGGMRFEKGTHKYGYLADAGELFERNRPWWCPELEPGDVVLMHSATWHASFEHWKGPDRILADIIYQPADDPSGIELLRGQWRTDLFLTKEMRENLFVRSRVSRIKELEARVAELEAK